MLDRNRASCIGCPTLWSPVWLWPVWLCCVWLCCVYTTAANLRADQTADPALITAAESSGFLRTTSYDQVISFCDRLSEKSAIVHRLQMGHSVEGRELPVLVLSKTEVDSLEDVRRDGRLVVFAMANIHAGEVCGKEALMMLARDLALRPDDALLESLSVVLAPIYNADGNERISRQNRKNQLGPSEGVGQRANLQGLDLNRDHVKLESPEARSLVSLLNRCDPGVVIDCHTTNGSRHRYTLTYDGPRHPATHPEILRFTRDFLPAVSRHLEQSTGYSTFFYGNFTRQHSRWETYPAEPRYNTQYVGLRQRIGILSEAYAYAEFEDRVRSTKSFVESCLRLLAQQADDVQTLLDKARQDASDPSATTEIAINFEASPFDKPHRVLGFEEDSQSPRDYDIPFWGDTRVTDSVQVPYAYFIPRELTETISTLERHGIELLDVREDIVLEVEAYRVKEIHRQAELFQGHRLVKLNVDAESHSQRISAGTVMAVTAQPLRALLINLLEPQSRDGLTCWNFFDDRLEVDQLFPVSRLLKPSDVLTIERAAPTKPDDRQPITFDLLYGEGEAPNFSGSFVFPLRWMTDDHYLLRRDDETVRVEALTGKAVPLFDRCDLEQRLAAHEAIDDNLAKTLATGEWLELSEDGARIVFRHLDDLFAATLDGKTLRRLTRSPGREELVSLSPDGKRVAFVRDFDLFVVPVELGQELQLTHDGTPLIRNGKADWVYYEEVNSRSWKAYRWSPDSKHIMFQRYDDSQVGEFVVPDNGAFLQSVEHERYPKAGQPNPRVRLGVVSCDGGNVTWLPLDQYSPDAMLITHFGWNPQGRAYVYVQDRCQRWLDYHDWNVAQNTSTILFRETTAAWVDNPGDPVFLKDGSFLLPSERSGWRHLYLFDSAGKMIRQVTDGEWEVRRIHGLTPDEKHVDFSGTKDSHLAEAVYRASLSGDQLRRVSPAGGDRRAIRNSTGSRFIEIVSDRRSPVRVFLHDQDGIILRTIDSNPVADVAQYQLLPVEFMQIGTRDEGVLEASLIKPPDFDANRKYPVWLLTYGGPHAPSLRDAWRGGRRYEQILAHMGLVVLRCDPRSASGKGAKSAWTAYRQLGVNELRDLEDAVQWLREQPFVDSQRIGMEGHSYGGFLTAYALTHCRLFAAGIAGAPVTDWRNYDTIYTERYMSTPQDNPEGYRKTSVVDAAAQLHGRLLLLHGARDDNVHFANTLQLADALQNANKSFEMMVYPQSRHGIHGDHYQKLKIDFIRRSLGLPEDSR